MTRRIVLLIAGCLLAAAFAAAQEPKKEKPRSATAAETMNEPKIKTEHIQVMRPASEEIELPLEFRMAIYEKVMENLYKTGRFQHVYRDGEQPPAEVNDLVKLEITVWGFKEGSARMRQVTTVTGQTHIRVRIRAVDAQGNERLSRNVGGDVMFFGENLRATDDLAKAIAGAIKKIVVPGKK
ncbi:MAG TPA: hypothetical protein VLA96_10345 [Terriglobales bacterium]|nr:hypothetical protein [Terriglobales bacterium]